MSPLRCWLHCSKKTDYRRKLHEFKNLWVFLSEAKTCNCACDSYFVCLFLGRFDFSCLCTEMLIDHFVESGERSFIMLMFVKYDKANKWIFIQNLWNLEKCTWTPSSNTHLFDMKGKHNWHVYLQTRTPHGHSVLHIQHVHRSCFEARVICNMGL